MITDWSGICYEYAFTTKKPVIFINTPMKIMNPNYKDINIEPYSIWSRDVIGKCIEVDNISKELNKNIDYLLKNKDKYTKKIDDLYHDSIYNIGNSGEVGAKYLVEIIKSKIDERRKNEK